MSGDIIFFRVSTSSHPSLNIWTLFYVRGMQVLISADLEVSAFDVFVFWALMG